MATKSYDVTEAAGFSADIELRIINDSPYIKIKDMTKEYSLWVITDDSSEVYLYNGDSQASGRQVCKINLSSADSINDKLNAIKSKIFFAKGLAADFEGNLEVTTADGKPAVVQRSDITLFSE